VVVAAQDQVSCDLDGEAAILNLKTGIYFGLNEVGAAIWRLVAEPRPISGIVDAIVTQYEVERERCERDVVALIGEMMSRGLVRISDGPGS